MAVITTGEAMADLAGRGWTEQAAAEAVASHAKEDGLSHVYGIARWLTPQCMDVIRGELEAHRQMHELGWCECPQGGGRQ